MSQTHSLMFVPSTIPTTHVQALQSRSSTEQEFSGAFKVSRTVLLWEEENFRVRDLLKKTHRKRVLGGRQRSNQRQSYRNS